MGIEIPPFEKLVQADQQDMETLQKMASEPMERVYLPSNPQTDYVYPLSDGSMARIAETVSVNGVRWQIPANTWFNVPLSVFKILKERDEQKERMPAIPNNQCIGEGSRETGVSLYV